MSSPIIHSSPKMEQGDNVRIITFSADGVRDVENWLAKDLEGCTEELCNFHLLLNFINIEFLGSVELETLVGLHQRMKAIGGRLTLFNVNEDIYEVITANNLEKFLGICREERMAPEGGSPTVVKGQADMPASAGTVCFGDPDKFVNCE